MLTFGAVEWGEEKRYMGGKTVQDNEPPWKSVKVW